MSESAEEIAPEVARWVAGAVGPFTVVGTHHWPHGESRVWSLASGDGERRFLKQHRRPNKWAREVYAYERWASGLGPLTPSLTSRSAAHQAILLSALGGETAQNVPVTPERERENYRRAGELLGALHRAHTNNWFGAMTVSGEPRDGAAEESGEAYVRRRFARVWNEAQSGGFLSTGETKFSRWNLEEKTGLFQDERPVANHGDYSPRNWLVSPEGGKLTGVIDWEHAAWDTRAADIARLYNREFIGRQDREEAFFTGYGAPPDERLRVQINVLRLYYAVGGLSWSAAHNDEKFFAENRASLRRLQEEPA